MNLTFLPAATREEVFNQMENYLLTCNLTIANKDQTRPWGGFFVIDEKDTEKFIRSFFADVAEKININNKLSPKILIVAPNKRLSWQYHFRRSEIWKLMGGAAAVATSDSDEEKENTILKPGEVIELKQGERHRLIGLDGWGIVAEIWQHTDPQDPSDEEDIVRLQDDFGR